MRIIKQKDTFKVESSQIGKFYIVDLLKNTCTCPHFRIRLQRIRGECKHILAVKEKYKKKPIIIKEFSSIIKFIKENQPIDSIILIKKYGAKKIDSLIKQTEIIEEHGFIRVLD